MANVTANKLLDLVRRSGLVDEAKLTSFLEKITSRHGEATLDDQPRLADLMVEEGLVTRWQADKLLAGKHKGFRLGKYKLLGEIGKGGMSRVYLAEHELMKRRVAVKVLPKNRVNDSSYLERFRLEARAVAKLDDPNIVRAYDIDNEGDVHYIVMEYVDGQDLHQMVSGQGPLDYDTAADYIAQVANGLQHAHEMGLVHRDIKPANCLVDRHNTVKLLDLGLAKLIEDDQTSLTMANEENVLGTADYLAPEQALNSHEADNRSDIYSLGCTLYFLLTGGPPFPEGSISERLLKHQTAKPESIFKARPDAPPSLVDICETMMSKKPDERFQSAGDVAARLKEWLADRGRAIGGVRLDDRDHDSGIGSGVFSRYAIGMPTPPSTNKSKPSGSSRTVSVSDRDTKKLDQKGSGPGGTDDEIGLAPLDEEDVLGVARRKTAKKSPTESDKVSAMELAASSDVVKGGSGSSKRSLIEEELHDAELEQIKRKVAQRAQFNPLQPPGFVPPSRGPSLAVWLGVGAAALAIVVLLLLLLAT
ncbi:MAG TPA: serine/threonine-protein kinase [Lacipirellulaceae bacterium]|nr:serine/threonine-protein kinase [Lacipirellulaceae bacterium]